MEPKDAKTLLEITDDLTTIKVLLREIVAVLSASSIKSRARSLAVTKLEEARMWIQEAQATE